MDKGQKKYMRYRYNLSLRFREQLVMALTDQNISQKDLAKKIGVSVSIVNRMYNGRYNGPLETWSKAFTALGIDVGFRDARTKNSLDIGPS